MFALGETVHRSLQAALISEVIAGRGLTSEGGNVPAISKLALFLGALFVFLSLFVP